MPTEAELAAYLDGSLPSADRARIETDAERDLTLRRQLVRHARMEAALRAALGDTAANVSVRRAVLAVTQGEGEAALKQRVLSDTVHLRRAPSWRDELAAGWARVWRLPTFAGAAVVLLLLIAFWPKQRTTHSPAMAGANLELPVRLLAADEVWRALGEGAKNWRAIAGATLRLPTNASGTLLFADGSALQLDPGAAVEFSAPGEAAAAGGKQLRLLAGSLIAQVRPQPEGRPLRVHTPHAVVTVVGTEFGLRVAGAETQLEVVSGSVKLARTMAEAPLAVGAGEAALATASAAPRQSRLPRNPLLWPFASDSIWNRPLGADAQFEPIAARPFTADGPLLNPTRSRRPFLANPSAPLRGVWEQDRWRGDIRLSDADVAHLPLDRNEPVVILQPARRQAVEVLGLRIRANGDLEARVVELLDLAGAGVGVSQPGLRPHGFSALGGLLRLGEPHSGVRHALAARVSADRLQAGAWPAWPAMGNRVPTGFGSDASNLRIGTLLALPPDVDIAALGLDTSGPGYELARALQDYGVYVTGVGPEPFVLLLGENRAGAEWESPALNRLVPLLQIVRNNTPQTPGGGGIPRREPAPELIPR